MDNSAERNKSEQEQPQLPVNELIRVRLEKVNNLRENGIEPYESALSKKFRPSTFPSPVMA